MDSGVGRHAPDGAGRKREEAEAQWTINSCLAQIGIHAPALRKRALAIGEELGVCRDDPVSKGCTSPFAPIRITEIVRRQRCGAPSR